MKRFSIRRPSPALIVAVIALFLSLGGVSYGLATGSIDSRELRDNTVRSRDLRNNDVRGGDVRNDSLTASDLRESTFSKVPTAGQSDIALSPVAYARVAADGDVIEAGSRGVTDANVSVESTSSYCFRNLGFPFKTPQVTVDFESAATRSPSLGTRAVASAALGNPFGDCAGPGVQLQVVTARADTAQPAKVGFFITFWN